MDVYVFVQALPGQARAVMEGLVAEGGAARAALITGEVDVLARIDDVGWDDLAGAILNGIQGVPGIARNWTAASVDIGWERMDLPTIPKPIRLPMSERMAFVFITTEPSQTEAVIKRVAVLPGVEAMTMLSGEQDLLAQVVGADLDAIADTVLADIRAVPGVLATSTSLILDILPPEASEG